MKKYQRDLLFILLFGTMLIFGFIEHFKGVSYPHIKEEFNASWEQQGFMVAMLSLGYTAFSVVAGIFLGRFGIKPSFLCGYASICLGLLLVFFLPGFYLATAALFIVFAGFGFFEIGVNALASRLFIKKAALLMNLLHSFYGIGAMIGPKAAGMIADNVNLGWRWVYLFSVPLVLVLFIPAILIRFPEDETAAGQMTRDEASFTATAARRSFFDALRSPMVWLMSLTLGLTVVVELSSSTWGPMYFRDMYGFNPGTDGATFLSAFFLVFTVSRIVCGPFIERIGYFRTLIGVSFIVVIIYTAGFLLGAGGIYVLPALGFFVALFWPTLMALAFTCFGRDAPVFSSAIIAISGLFVAGVQYIVGLTNKIFGPAWGYRSSLGYTVLLIAALFVLYKKFRQQETAQV